MIQKYIKKPVVIEAVQYTGLNVREVCDFVNFAIREYLPGSKDSYIMIQTLEGDMKANRGDYIIKGVNGEFYSCKPDIFEKTYEKID